MHKLIVANSRQYDLKSFLKNAMHDKVVGMVGHGYNTPKIQIYYVHKVKLPK